MDLKEYFQTTSGTGVLATADSEGKVNVAIFSRPYMIDNMTLALIMADRLTRKNLQSNPHAAFLFLESIESYTGRRLHLTKIKEGIGEDEVNQELKEKFDRAREKYANESLYLVYFRVDKVLPLVMNTT